MTVRRATASAEYFIAVCAMFFHVWDIQQKDSRNTVALIALHFPIFFTFCLVVNVAIFPENLGFVVIIQTNGFVISFACFT